MLEHSICSQNSEETSEVSLGESENFSCTDYDLQFSYEQRDWQKSIVYENFCDRSVKLLFGEKAVAKKKKL